MLLALPFQAIAAAAMPACALDAPAIEGQAGAHAPEASEQDDGARHPCHETLAQAPEGTSERTSEPTSERASDGHDHEGRCSACAACCMGAVLAPAPAIVAPPPALNTALPMTDSGRLAAVDLALPERPPRFVRA